MIIIKDKNKNSDISIIKSSTIAVINGNLNFSKIGYSAEDTSNAYDVLNDAIQYAEVVKKTYTDSKTYQSDAKLIYFPVVDTNNRTSCANMFKNCGSLQYVPPLTISNKCTSLNSMFYGCNLLTSIDVSNFDTSNVTNMAFMFNSCKLITTLDLSNWDISNVTDISSMFSSCSKLTAIDLSNWNTNNVTNMASMFRYCELITALDLSNWNTINVTNMAYMFNSCELITVLDLSNWDVSNVTSMSSMFSSCTSLTNFQAPQNINVNIAFNGCNNLTIDSLLSILNNLTDRTATTTLTCTLGTINLNKLTDEQKAIATAKNWVLK